MDDLTTSCEPMDPTATWDRWIAAKWNPWVDDEDRREAKKDLRRLIADSNDRWAVWALADLLGFVARSLPSDDPWLRLTGYLTIPGGDAPFEVGPHATALECLPDPSGAWVVHHLEGRPRWDRFGAVTSHVDIQRIDNSDLSRDPELCAVAKPLSRESAYLIAAAANHRPTRELCALWDSWSDVGSHQRAAHLLAIVEPALRWLAFRRRCYRQADREGFFILAAAAAAQWASVCLNGEAPWGEEPDDAADWRAPIVEMGRIDDGSWEALNRALAAIR